MSTRSQIGFYEDDTKKLEEFEALIYRHSDGYPSGVLPDIMPFLSWWAKGRGMNDTEYLSARLLQYLCNEYDAHTVEWAKGRLDRAFGNKEETLKEIEMTEKFTGELGHGICKGFHCDIEYLYAISPSGVMVFEVSIGNWEDFKNEDINKAVKKVGIIPFKNYEENADYKKLIKE